jgi:streptomycin 6-kinase
LHRRQWNVPDIAIPARLADYAGRSDEQQAWLTQLPARVAELTERWSLAVGEPFEPGGVAAWVAPARQGTHDYVLKVGFRHYEAEHEADGLRTWNGNGAVHLHDAFVTDDTAAMLLERCVPGTGLEQRAGHEQDEVIATLLRRLWIEPPQPSPFRPLQQLCDDWADAFERKRAAGRVTIDPGLARTGVELFRTLSASADRTVVLCTDLHAENVLAAQREPWLVIDPKPYVGDPTYDPLQHMLNRADALRADPHALVNRMAALCELDADRLQQWLFARCVEESPDWPGLDDVARQLAP